MTATAPPPDGAAAAALAEAHAKLRSRLAAAEKMPVGRGLPDRDGPVGCGAKWAGLLPDFRYVQESVPNTLGWPVVVPGHGGAAGTGARSTGPSPEPSPLTDGFAAMLAGDGEAAALAFRWLATVAAGFELAIVMEYFDESLLLLGKEMGWPVQDLMYLSQVRGRRDRNPLPPAPAPHRPHSRAPLPEGTTPSNLSHAPSSSFAIRSSLPFQTPRRSAASPTAPPRLTHTTERPPRAPSPIAACSGSSMLGLRPRPSTISTRPGCGRTSSTQ